MRNPKMMTLDEALKSPVKNVYQAARMISEHWDGDMDVTMDALSECQNKLIRGCSYMILHELTVRAIEDAQRPIPFSVEYGRCSHLFMEKPRSLV